MRRFAASAVIAALLLIAWTPAARAGSKDVRFGLTLFGPPLPLLPIPVPVLVHRPVHRPAVIHRPVVVHRPLVHREVVYVRPRPTVVYQAPAVVYSPPPPVEPPPPTVIYYPHGRYELHLQGQQYVWVWIPATPPPPPPPAAGPAPIQ